MRCSSPFGRKEQNCFDPSGVRWQADGSHHTTIDSAKPLLEVQNLTCRFGHNHVLRDINLQVARGRDRGHHRGEWLRENGATEVPDWPDSTHGGDWSLFDGHDLAKLSGKELTHQRIRYGFVFQTAALFDSLTVGQNIAFPLREHTNHSEERIREIVMSSLADVGLPDHVVARNPPSSLEGCVNA
jgi:phospholipid/cholesterol/gamma-HCH transport system ATP-binding protein